MQSKIMLPFEVLEKIEKELRSHSSISMDTNIIIVVEKKILNKLSRDVLKFLSKFAVRYVRNRYRLRPSSFQSFLKLRKYKETDAVEFHIPLEELINSGILRREHHDNYMYWVLQDKILDPRNYIALYKLYDDTLKTLLYRLGYLELFKKYENKIEIPESLHSNQIAIVKLDEIEINVFVDNFMVSCDYIVDRKCRIHRKTINLDKEDKVGWISVYFYVENPTVEDVEKIRKYIEYTEFMLAELLSNVKVYIERELGIPFTSVTVDGNIYVHNYRLEDIWLDITRSNQIGRITEHFELGIRVRRNRYRRRFLNDCMISHIRASKLLISMYIYNAFTDIKDLKNFMNSLPHYNIIFRVGNKVGLHFEAELTGILNYSNIPKHYIAIKHAERILKEILRRDLEKNSGRELRNLYGESTTIGNILEFLNWWNIGDIDTVRFKLSAFKLEGLDKSGADLKNKLIAYAVLEGLNQEKLAEALNRPLDVLLELIRSMKLKLVPHKDGYRIEFRGKNLREVFSYKHYKPKIFEKTIRILLGMSLPRNVVEKVSRKTIYI